MGCYCKPETIIAEVKDTVSYWSDFAIKAQVSDELNDMIQKYVMVDVKG